MNIAHNERLLDKLAAEYVLGTLRGGARRRFETWLRADALVQRATAEWQDRLHPMAQLALAVTPPDTVWQNIHRRLDLPAAAARVLAADGGMASAIGASSESTAGGKIAPVKSVQPAATDRWAFWRGLRDDLGFWRGLGMASTAVATILVAVLASRPSAPVSIAVNTPATTTPLPTPSAMPSYVAMLADDKAQPIAVITGDTSRHLLTVRMVSPQNLAPDRSLELWAIPKAGSPRSLGLLAANGSISLPLPVDATPQSVAALAVSLEPKGGSPKRDSPTGPVLFKGAWLAI